MAAVRPEKPPPTTRMALDILDILLRCCIAAEEGRPASRRGKKRADHKGPTPDRWPAPPERSGPQELLAHSCREMVAEGCPPPGRHLKPEPFSGARATAGNGIPFLDGPTRRIASAAGNGGGPRAAPDGQCRRLVGDDLVVGLLEDLGLAGGRDRTWSSRSTSTCCRPDP